MTNEIESLTSDLNSRRTGSGGSPMLFAVVGLALLLAGYAHWRFGQFDERIDRVRGQVTELRTEQDSSRRADRDRQHPAAAVQRTGPHPDQLAG